jgi:uncharacterized protein (DUF1778 family)
MAGRPRVLTNEQRLENQKKTRAKTPLCNFRAAQSFIDRVDNAAKSKGISRTEFLVNVIARFLDDNNF